MKGSFLKVHKNCLITFHFLVISARKSELLFAAWVSPWVPQQRRGERRRRRRRGRWRRRRRRKRRRGTLPGEASAEVPGASPGSLGCPEPENPHFLLLCMFYPSAYCQMPRGVLSLRGDGAGITPRIYPKCPGYFLQCCQHTNRPWLPAKPGRMQHLEEKWRFLRPALSGLRCAEAQQPKESSRI